MKDYKILIKSFLCVFLMTHLSNIGFAQITNKPVVDSAAVVSWPIFGYPDISNDGNFFSYEINNQPVGGKTLVVKLTLNSWQRTFINIDPGFFSVDGRQYIYKSHDTLFFLRLNTNEPARIIPGVSSWQKIDSKKYNLLVYRLTNSENNLSLLDLSSGKTSVFNAVRNYFTDKQGERMVIQSLQDYRVALTLINLGDFKAKSIYISKNASFAKTSITDLTFDVTGDQLAFIAELNDKGQTSNSIWYYKLGMDMAVRKASNHSSDLPPELMVGDDGLRFTDNGRYLLFRLDSTKTTVKRSKEIGPIVDIWNYKDSIENFFLPPKNRQSSCLASINVSKDVTVLLTRTIETTSAECSNYLIAYPEPVITEEWWPTYKGLNHEVYLVSIKNGTRRNIPFVSGYFSPSNHYLVYFDSKAGCFCSYNLLTSQVYNLTGDLDTKFSSQPYEANFPNLEDLIGPVGVSGWLQGSENLLVYDAFGDIWKLDAENKNPPVNLTNGYGKATHTEFRIVDDFPGKCFTGDHLLLVAFNKLTKYNGFFRISIRHQQTPEILSMEPCTVCHNGSLFTDEFSSGMPPIKAANTNRWIVRRESATAAPNYFLTNDFKTYRPLTDLQPQKAYNWFTTEVISWTLPDGTQTQGILYKPENFDGTKKYPVIFQYYEKFSHRAYEFANPRFTDGRINIPWFVSRGYLVFTPDIHYDKAPPGESAANTMISAARLLSKLSYVDSAHMGLQGHSFGGVETYNIVTRTSIFAAAAPFAGTSDLINCAYGAPALIAYNKMMIIEKGQERIGGDLWQQQKEYIDNSAIFAVNKIVTPLLIVHNKGDKAIPWVDGVEMFTALRRLQKKVWMLQYDGETHTLDQQKNAIDYTIRLNEFFDYYLKGAPPPVWMTTVIDPGLKGIYEGYQLDYSGKTP